MILEGLVTTLGDNGSPHVAPMGPIVDPDMSRLVLRPFRTSRTFGNLRRSRQGVFHITDDVELLARAAVQRLEQFPTVLPARAVAGVILADACRWYAFRVLAVDEREPRAQLDCEVVDSGRFRDFLGFNRAKHAVIEAAILATRIGLMEKGQVLDEFQRLAVIVDKTGGPQEQRAFSFLHDYLREAPGAAAEGPTP